MIYARGMGMPVAVGTPADIVDQMEFYMDESGAEGFMLVAAHTPGCFEEFVDRHWGGDHSIFVGKVTWAEERSDHLPLVYHGGGYALLIGAEHLENARMASRAATK